MLLLRLLSRCFLSHLHNRCVRSHHSRIIVEKLRVNVKGCVEVDLINDAWVDAGELAGHLEDALD